jgi:flagellar biosynthesis regulator FlbT
MANMSYCRFRNTLNDLLDCQYNFDNISSIEELVAAQRLFKMCQESVDIVDIEDLEMVKEEYDEDE